MSRLTESFVIDPEHIQSKKSTTVCTPTVAIATFMMLAASTLSVTSFKIQGDKYNFKHGPFQAILMFIGEWMNILIFGIIMVIIYFFI